MSRSQLPCETRKCDIMKVKTRWQSSTSWYSLQKVLHHQPASRDLLMDCHYCRHWHWHWHTLLTLETLVMSVKNSGQLVFKVACPFNSHASSRRTRCLRDNCYSTYVCTHLIYIHIHIRASCRVKWFISAWGLGGGNNNSSSENENITALSALSVLLYSQKYQSSGNERMTGWTQPRHFFPQELKMEK